MSLIVSGLVVPVSNDPNVAASESKAFDGSVFIDDAGTIAAVVRKGAAEPAGFSNAQKIKITDGLILPGLIDLHSHLAYATLPLWVEEGRTQPFAHHDSWPRSPTYAAEITWPAYAFITASPQELLAYAELRALVGGTTSIQGSPPSNRPLDGWLVRNVEDERLGGTIPGTRVLSSTLTLKNEQLATRAGQMRDGSLFIYHCAEGCLNSIVAREYQDARMQDCLQRNFVAIHTNAVKPTEYAQWSPAGTIVWSPFSNLWLYGQTTDVAAAMANGIRVCVGSDWGPSGTRNVLGEIKVASLVSKDRGWNLSAFDLVRMITANPGDALSVAWAKTVGRLQPGALADVTVIKAAQGADPFSAVVSATEADIALVVVGGRALYGHNTLMAAIDNPAKTELGPDHTVSLRKYLAPKEPWSVKQILDRMEKVRATPKTEIEKAKRLAFASLSVGEEPPLRLALDMPTGKAPIGGLPKDLSKIVVPPIQPFAHDKDFFDSIRNRGFHGGLLDDLAKFYP